MAGHEVARFNLGHMEGENRNVDQVVKHWTIAASGGEEISMLMLITLFKQGFVNRESVNSTLAAYNDCCVEMRSKAGDAHINMRRIEFIEE